MAWEQCVVNIRQTLDPNAKEVGEVDWSNRSVVTQEDLDSDSFGANKPFALICPDRHCYEDADFSPAAHRICQCVDINGNRIPNCDPKDALYPYPSSVCLDITDPTKYSSLRGRSCTRQGPDYYQLTCNCCCSCYANGTRIAIPTGAKPIEYFAVGDEVMTASYDKKTKKVTWRPSRVSFSQGTGDSGHQSTMIYLHYGEDDRQIIVSTDQVFLLSTGDLIRADRLVPGKHELMNEWGEAVVIHEVSRGEYEGGVHHISTGNTTKGEGINGHLLLSEGVISGDFSVQINTKSLIDEGHMLDHAKLPKIGSKEYKKKHTHLSETIYNVMSKAVSKTHEPKVLRPLKFFVHGEKKIDIPQNHSAYFDSAQAEDIRKNSPSWDFSEVGQNSSTVKYLLRLFSGFYPGIKFYYDLHNQTPNAYGFEQFGQVSVVITGGLTNVKGLGQDGLSMILSHMVSTVQRAAPLDKNHWTSVGMADYYSISVLIDVYYLNSYDAVYKAGVKEIEDTLFKYIAKKNDKYSNDPYHPTIDMRLDALDAGKAMDFPPAGIGGPIRGGLEVVKAVAMPPMVGMGSFVNRNIDMDASIDVYKALEGKKIIDSEGAISKSFNVNTDLSFLFPSDKDKDHKEMLIGSVRYTLLHAPGLIELEFNELLNEKSAGSVYDFQISPEVDLIAVQPKENVPVVEILANIELGTKYTITASSNVRSSIGSTMNPKKNSATFTVS